MNKLSAVKLLVFFKLLVLSIFVSAAVIPSDSSISVLHAADSNVDVLNVRAPNASGISINYFSEFSVTDRPLNIVNVASLGSVSAPGQAKNAAEVIVIIADVISLQNEIKVLGPPSEVVFLSTHPSGYINCNSCVFDNFLRVTLATAEPLESLQQVASHVGELSPGFSSSININYLNAPGAVAVDVITQQLTLNGIIETHQRAVRDVDGGYQSDHSGNLTIGSGAVNLVLGPITWDYDQRQITSVNAYSGTHTLGGTIRSSAVKISATGDLVVNTFSDTRSNLLSSVDYRGDVYLPQEGVELQTFANNALTVSGDQRSAGTVSFRATGDLALSSLQTDIEASQVELIAGGTLTTIANLNAREVSLAGDRVINQGDIVADADINIWAHKQLANQYGGLIKAETVRLQSVTQAIRNGSRTPYISQTAETDYLFNMDDYVNQLDPTKLGTFYSLEEIDVSNNSYIMAEDNSAHIVADRIEIQGQAFENINPYYEKVEDQDEVVLQRKFIEQVSVSAESYLGIAATNYIVNSSAYMIVSHSSGLFEVNTRVLTNERYRILNELVTLQEISSTDISYDIGTPGYTEETYTEFQDSLLSYSPPGIIATLGKAKIKTSHSFINNTAYLEVYGDAVFDTPLINDIGYESQLITQEELFKLIWCGSLSCGGVTGAIRITAPNINSVLVPVELDSLFFIHGNLQANASLAWFKNHNPIDKYVDQAIENIIDLYYPEINDGVYVSTVEEAKSDGTIKVGTSSYSLFDELKKLYDSLIDSVADFFAELDWWQ